MESMSSEQFPAPEAAPQAGSAQPMRMAGLDHLTLICSNLERTTSFYRDVLGLALVNESVNADDPATRHFWFSSGGDQPLRLSFTEYPQMTPAAQGSGGVHHIALSVGSADEVAAWRDYLQQRSIPTTEVFDRDQLCSIYLRDPDGQILEFAARPD